MQIREYAEKTPDRAAVTLYPAATTVTFAEMEARANQLARFFRERGLCEGDVVAILMDNNEHIHTVMWGARRSGLYYVPINTHLTASEAAYIVENSGATAIIASAALRPVCEDRMLKLPAAVRDSYDVSSLQRVMHAAAPCPVEIKRQMIDWWGPIVDEYYASSEAVGATLITAEEWLAHPGSVGKPSVGVIHIVGEDGEEVPTGQEGEIFFEGTTTFEYLNDPVKTAASRHDRGWVSVGDVGYVDEDGYLYLTDRRHHMIISGGVNIYPQEAENMLIAHPRVADAAVFGIPDEDMGQSVKGVVQTVDPADATDEFAAELLAWLRDRLAHFKCLRSISFEKTLPRTDTGKLYKQELIEKYSATAAAGRG